MLEVAYASGYKSEKAKVDGLKSVMNWTLECVRYSNIITTFDIRRQGPRQEFEKFSSGSEESDEDGPGSEESPDENELIVEKNDDLFKSDHEFSCESDVPETEAQIVKHARTVTKGGKRKRGRPSKDEKMDVDEESEEGIVNFFKEAFTFYVDNIFGIFNPSLPLHRKPI